MKNIIFFILWGIIAQNAYSKALIPQNFEDAKKTAQFIWNEHRETFYCGCTYNKQGIINYNSCSYIPMNKRKAKRIGWEHVVPVSWYGRQLSCWTQQECITKKGKNLKGRKCCRKKSENFRKMEADLHNLVPVIREVNTARKNYRFFEYSKENNKKLKYYFNHCPIIIDAKNKCVEPRDEVKGMISRINFYMAEKYHIPMTQEEVQLMTDWNKRYPVSSWEKRWDQKVAAIQGDHNPYITLTRKER
jgi:deoxyribonuclease-1